MYRLDMCRAVRRAVRTTTALAFLAIVGLSAAHAQDSRPPDITLPAGKPCKVFASGDGRVAPKHLWAFCGDHALSLGPVTDFTAIDNTDLQATLIDAYLGEVRRILLISTQVDGHTLLEDLTGQIAFEAGRGPMSAIDGLTLDFKGFAHSGDIAVRPRPGDRPDLAAIDIDLGRQLARERARRVSAAGAP